MIKLACSARSSLNDAVGVRAVDGLFPVAEWACQGGLSASLFVKDRPDQGCDRNQCAGS